MRIASLTLTNFKRFTELTINDLPAAAKLVLLIGGNGSGKSSVFDAFNLFRKHVEGPEEQRYYRKDSAQEPRAGVKFWHGEYLGRLGPATSIGSKAKFFGRPSIRNVPTVEQVREVESRIKSDADNPGRFTNFDQRFLADVAHFTNQIDRAMREPVFEGRSADTLAIYRRHVDPLNDSFQRIFGDRPETTI